MPAPIGRRPCRARRVWSNLSSNIERARQRRSRLAPCASNLPVDASTRAGDQTSRLPPQRVVGACSSRCPAIARPPGDEDAVSSTLLGWRCPMGGGAQMRPHHARACLGGA
eukprot:scaffold122844_cov42-Phaeocystis_antarctica.AAC.1